MSMVTGLAPAFGVGPPSKLTVLYDNYSLVEGTQADWGFACLIEGDNPESMEVVEHLGYREFEGVRYFTKRTHPDI